MIVDHRQVPNRALDTEVQQRMREKAVTIRVISPDLRTIDQSRGVVGSWEWKRKQAESDAKSEIE